MNKEILFYCVASWSWSMVKLKHIFIQNHYHFGNLIKCSKCFYCVLILVFLFFGRGLGVWNESFSAHIAVFMSLLEKRIESVGSNVWQKTPLCTFSMQKQKKVCSYILHIFLAKKNPKKRKKERNTIVYF